MDKKSDVAGSNSGGVVGSRSEIVLVSWKKIKNKTLNKANNKKQIAVKPK